MSKKNNTVTTILVTILVVLSLGIACLIGNKIYTEHGRDSWNVRWQDGQLHIEGNHHSR